MLFRSDRLTSQHTLAVCLWDAGEREAAISLMRKVVSVRRQVLDDTHPKRQGSEDWLVHFEREVAGFATS